MPRMTLLAPILATVALSACARSETRARSGEAQMVSLVVRSEPSGARVRVGNLIKTWLTPCDIADFGITKGMLDLDISLEGYDPVTPRVYYDGEHPVKIEAKLISHRPPAPAPEPAKAAAPPVSAAPEIQAGIQIRVEAVQGGTRLTVSPPRGRVRITSGILMTDADRGGIYFLANVPPEKAVVEVLDPVTDAVLQVLTIPGTSPAPTPAAAVPAAAPPPFYAVPQAPAPTYYAVPAAAVPQAAPAPTYYYAVPAAAPAAPAAPAYYYAPLTAPQVAPSPTYYYIPVTAPR